MANLQKKQLVDDPFGTVPMSFNQLGILLLDGSGSMLGEARGGLKKHQALNNAVREVFSRFKVSTKRKCFSWATVVFGVDVAIQTPITSAELIDDNGSYDPLYPKLVDGNGTCIGVGLTACRGIAEQFLETRITGIPNKVAIVILSDGMSEVTQTLSVAQSIKSNPDLELYCCHFVSPNPSENESGASDLLRSLASDPVKGYKTVYDEETIRSFFIASVSSSAGIANPF
jgi:hypothetical protein